MKYLFHLILILLLFSQLQAQTPHKQTSAFVFSGVIMNNNNVQLLQDFTAYISKKSDIPLKPAYVNSYTELSRLLKEHPHSLAWTCGAPFVVAHKKAEEKLVAVPLYKGVPTYHSVIITKKPSTKKCISEFKGEILAYSDPLSNSGYLAPKYHLAQSKIKLKEHFSLMLNTGSHEGSITAVRGGLADIAAVDEYILDTYLLKNPDAKKELKEIKRLGPFPFTPIVTGKEVSPQEIKRLKSIFTQMENDPEGRRLLKAFSLDGFVLKETEFYQPIEKMIESVGLDTPW